MDPDAAAVLADVGPKVVLPALTTFVERATTLATAIAAWQAAVEAGTATSEQRDGVQAAWRDAMATWEQLEVFQIGPAASSLSAVGGQDLRDLVYSWPTVSRCRVDQETAGDAWRQDDFFVARNVNVLGLGALETLLFSPDGETGCVGDDVPAGWDTLGSDGVARRRAAYAAAVAAHVQQVAETLRDAWSPDGGDFSGDLAAAGTGTSSYATQGEGLDAVLDALFYVDTRTKERKIARPLGLRDCAGLPCTSEVETQLAGGSNDWIVANLQGYRALLTGGDGKGLDDLLVAHGASDVRDDLLAKLDAADAAAAAITVPIDEAVTTQAAAMQALYDAVDAVDYVLKTTVATDLSLQVPSEASGDND